MKASELRIGNWIYDLSLSPTKVVGTGTNCIWISEVGPGIDSAFQPIPLSEEWLIKFGFIKILSYPVFSRNDVRIEYNGFDGEWRADLTGHRLVIKYVHQLQNLYFALTGEELTIKE